MFHSNSQYLGGFYTENRKKKPSTLKQATSSSRPTNEEILQAEMTAPFNTMMQFNSLRRRYDELHRDLNRPFHRRNYNDESGSSSSSSSGRGPSHPRRSLNQITQQYYLQRLNSRRTVSRFLLKTINYLSENRHFTRNRLVLVLFQLCVEVSCRGFFNSKLEKQIYSKKPLHLIPNYFEVAHFQFDMK